MTSSPTDCGTPLNSTCQVGLTVNCQTSARSPSGGAVRLRVSTLSNVEDHEVLKIHAFYVRHILPLKVEVQYFNWKQQP